MKTCEDDDTTTRSGTILVLLDPSQRDHPTMQSLRWHAGRTDLKLLEVHDPAIQQPCTSEQITAVTGVGEHADAAARYAIEHDLIHLELRQSGPAGHLDAALRTTPDEATIISVNVDGETKRALDRIEIESDDPLDIAVDRHQWFDITGPISIHTTTSEGDVWITIHHGATTVLSASPALSSSVHVTTRGDARVRTDNDKWTRARRRNLKVSFLLRRRTIQFRVLAAHHPT